MTRRRRRGAARRSPTDEGRALIEVVFLAILLLIPTVYILIGVLRLQATTLAVAQAARDVGRLIETSPALPTLEQATAVARIALDDQRVAADEMRIATTQPGRECARSTSATFSRQAGIDYAVCVIAIVSLPGIPTALGGARNSVTGVYTVHIDELREGR